MSKQPTKCLQCTRLFKRGFQTHTNSRTGVITKDRELICVFKNLKMNNLLVHECDSFKQKIDRGLERNLIPGKTINANV